MREPHPRSWPIRYVIGVFSLFLCSVLTKFSVEGKNNLPPTGPYILAPNHIDDVDPAPITAAVVKPITYLMAEDQAELPWYKAWGPWSLWSYVGKQIKPSGFYHKKHSKTNTKKKR